MLAVAGMLGQEILGYGNWLDAPSSVSSRIASAFKVCLEMKWTALSFTNGLSNFCLRKVSRSEGELREGLRTGRDTGFSHLYVETYVEPVHKKKSRAS
jgi:hypothetical protein